MKLNFESPKMQKLIMVMYKTQSIDDVYFYVFMFIPGVLVIKISKFVSFFVFSADDSKKLDAFAAKYLSASEYI